jgi:alpha-galactosidase
MKEEVNSINIARLLSELEGSYTLTKYMGFEDDMKILDEMKKRFYKIYFKLYKEERNNGV